MATTREPAPQQAGTDNLPPAGGPRMGFPWGMALLVAFAFVTLLELVRYHLLRELEIWQSHMLTAAALTVSLLAATYYGYRQWEKQRSAAEDALRAHGRALSLLAEERIRFDALLRHSTDHIYFKDINSRFALVSGRMAQWFGLDRPEDALGRTDADFFSPEHAEQARRDEEELLSGARAAISKEERETWPDGHVTWVSTTKLPLRDEAGRIVGTFGISRDITPQKQAEQQLEAYRTRLEGMVAERTAALQESEERYRRLLASVTDYVYEVEVRDGRPAATRHGPGCEAITGYSPADYERNPFMWLEMVHPDDRRAVVEQSRQVLAGATTQPLEHRIFHKNGSPRWVRNTAVARRDGEGGVIGYDGLVQDITERKTAEEARLEMERQMMAARQREALERADRLSSLGYLATGVAHEVNNPLQGMLSHLSVVRRSLPEDPVAARSLAMVERGIQSIASLMQRLLWLGGEPDRATAHSSISDALQFVRDLLGPQLEQADIRLVFDVKAAYVEVAVPHQELVQVLMNLLMNAKDAMPGGGRVTIAVDQRDRYAELSVTDTGAGIAPENLSRVFAPFFTTKGTRGTGLGLSVAESLLRGRGGRIRVESEVGKGTRFVLSLPLAEKKHEATHPDRR